MTDEADQVDGAGHDGDLPWDPPRGQRPAPEPGPDQAEASEAGRIDRSGAALTAGLFGVLAGLTLPPLLFWVTFSLMSWVGAPDLLIVLVAVAVAFGGPIVLFFWMMGLLGRSAPRYDGARTALTIAASVTMGMWLLIAILATLVILVLRQMA